MPFLFEIILHFQLHTPPPEFWISATSDVQEASKGDKLVSCMASYQLGEFTECFVSRSLSLRRLQFLAPCQYRNPLHFSSCLFWVEGGDELCPEELAGSLVAANLGDLGCTHLILWFFSILLPPHFVCWLSLSLGLNWTYIQLYHNSTLSTWHVLWAILKHSS